MAGKKNSNNKTEEAKTNLAFWTISAFWILQKKKKYLDPYRSQSLLLFLVFFHLIWL